MPWRPLLPIDGVLHGRDCNPVPFMRRASLVQSGRWQRTAIGMQASAGRAWDLPWPHPGSRGTFLIGAWRRGRIAAVELATDDYSVDGTRTAYDIGSGLQISKGQGTMAVVDRRSSSALDQGLGGARVTECNMWARVQRTCRSREARPPATRRRPPLIGAPPGLVDQGRSGPATALACATIQHNNSFYRTEAYYLSLLHNASRDRDVT